MSSTVLITGSATGIGAATALHFARLGWHVVVNYSRSRTEGEAVADACRAAAGDALLVQADVAQDADCRRLVAETVAKFGRIDALVNNAGVTKFAALKDLEALSAADFTRLTEVNVASMFQMARAAAPHLRAAKANNVASIVNVTSRAGISGAGSSIAYAASKAAANTLTISLARALAPEIRVNAVAPGFVTTAWHDRQAEGEAGKALHAKHATAYAARAVLQKTVSAEEVADTIVWLTTGARAMTGQIISVDAGASLA